MKKTTMRPLQPTPNRQTNQLGFSLTELLIVICIIAIIAAISIPLIKGYMESIREQQVNAKLSNIGTAANTFRTAGGQRRYPTLDELRVKLPGQNAPLISPLDAPVAGLNGWMIQGCGSTATAFCAYAYKIGKTPSLTNKKFYAVYEDGTVYQVTSGAIGDRTNVIPVQK
jgi:prepilin-type N-terminal cleavage/methylation domain-containing protein